MAEVVLRSALTFWSVFATLLLLSVEVKSQVFDTLDLASPFGTFPAPDRTSVPTSCPSEVDIAGRLLSLFIIICIIIVVKILVSRQHLDLHLIRRITVNAKGLRKNTSRG